MMSVLHHESGHGKAFYHRLDLRESLVYSICHFGTMTGSAQPHDFQGNFGNLS